MAVYFGLSVPNGEGFDLTICSQKGYEENWAAAGKELGLKWIPILHTGGWHFNGEYAPELFEELEQVKQAFLEDKARLVQTKKYTTDIDWAVKVIERMQEALRIVMETPEAEACIT